MTKPTNITREATLGFLKRTLWQVKDVSTRLPNDGEHQLGRLREIESLLRLSETPPPHVIDDCRRQANRILAHCAERAQEQACSDDVDFVFFQQFPAREDLVDLNIYISTEPSTTCPLCGARGKFIDLAPGTEFHVCLDRECGYRFPVRDYEQRDAFEVALDAVLQYYWYDELGDFAANPEQEHVFRHLVTLFNWLEKQNWTAEECVSRAEEHGQVSQGCHEDEED